MFKHRRTLVTVLAAVLAFLMILSIVVMMIPQSGATDLQAELDKLKKQAKTIASNKSSLQSELSSIRTQKRNASKEKENLDMQIAVLDEQIATSEALIETLDMYIAQKELELEDALLDEQEEYALFKRRVREMEEKSHQSEWAVLLGAENFSDFLSKAEVISDIINYDRKLMQELRATREVIVEARAALAEERAYYEQVRLDFEAQRAEAEEKKIEQENFIQNLEAEEKLTAEELADLVKEEEAAAKEIDRVSKELAKRKTYVGGDYMWPLPAGYTTITCHYGYRTHPVTGKKNSLHTGTDIGAPKGTEIYAANSGTVILATYSSSWGNYVMIDHGGGNVTLYAHMSQIKTKLNAEVKKGQVIGLVGSTGWSTGPHLHFELRVNGTPTDVMKIFKSQ